MHLVIENSKPIRAAAAYIRLSVFVIERHIALEDEFDDTDSDQEIYAVCFDGRTPAATCRFEKVAPQTLKIGRVATLKQYRHQGLGTKVLTAMETYAIEHHYKQSVIHSEVTAKDFYEHLGYHIASEIFIEDGVPCVNMKKSLESH
ncbi:GNAT family N-acetyltransferase [Lentilactobacillus parafarraginis]|jgi:predicted GNAT family N-acyltransferase|uniref:GNAT family N-acetyltransferase n=2 Tax=Lentilactobacillus parafarraginis TaxID=390842 RepID=A0A5R9CTA3_9LACO|nr:GNAT family N-acetyltransferase [Lentilactobacillus parafarraginis]EHL96252.1 acetyltransferase, GNAT family [Lentilactobacillus parafarraginis F0439]TLQ18542.1 GNAT family N-acetyltransferase [Lentilactobacillus parafarraginis]